MTITWDIAAILSAIMWPLVILILVLSFRNKLPDLVERFAGRVTKLSAFELSIELATFPDPPCPWPDPDIPQNSEMTGGEVSSTTLMTLFERIDVTSPWDYLIIDIKDGHFWLISRLFIFTVFLQALRGVKCVVFVESKNKNYCQFIGLTSADDVRAALNTECPWLEAALLKAMIQKNITSLHPWLSSDEASQLIYEFINHPEMRKNEFPDSSDRWTQLGTHSIWEHTEWLTSQKVIKYLHRVFYDWDLSHYKDVPGIQADKRMRELLHRPVPYIALVNSKGEFKSLLSRQKLLEQVAQSL